MRVHFRETTVIDHANAVRRDAARFPEKRCNFCENISTPFGANKTREESSIGNCRVAVKALNAVAERFTGEIERDAEVPSGSSCELFLSRLASNSFPGIYIFLINTLPTATRDGGVVALRDTKLE